MRFRAHAFVVTLAASATKRPILTLSNALREMQLKAGPAAVEALDRERIELGFAKCL
jgi:hypothetical protein